MAIYEDLTRGHDRDDALEVIDEKMPDWQTSEDPSSEMLALVLLDMHYDLRQPGDYVYIAPVYQWAIMPFVILEPTIAKLFQADESDVPNEADEAAATERGTREPFEIKLTYNQALVAEGDLSDADALPEELRGQTLLVRFMTAEDAERLPPMITVRADGTPITLPSDGLPDHVG